MLRDPLHRLPTPQLKQQIDGSVEPPMMPPPDAPLGFNLFEITNQSYQTLLGTTLDFISEHQLYDHKCSPDKGSVRFTKTTWEGTLEMHIHFYKCGNKEYAVELRRVAGPSTMFQHYKSHLLSKLDTNFGPPAQKFDFGMNVDQQCVAEWDRILQDNELWTMWRSVMSQTRRACSEKEHREVLREHKSFTRSILEQVRLWSAGEKLTVDDGTVVLALECLQQLELTVPAESLGPLLTRAINNESRQLQLAVLQLLKGEVLERSGWDKISSAVEAMDFGGALETVAKGLLAQPVRSR